MAFRSFQGSGAGKHFCVLWSDLRLDNDDYITGSLQVAMIVPEETPMSSHLFKVFKILQKLPNVHIYILFCIDTFIYFISFWGMGMPELINTDLV